MHSLYRSDSERLKHQRTGIWVVRPEAETIGKRLANKLCGHLGGLDLPAGKSNRQAFVSAFSCFPQWVKVMATGISVRYLQPLLQHKSCDPGVVVLDEGCRFAISLVGGHEGGANLLAYQVSNIIGAVPVITTATETTKSLIFGVGCRKGVSSEQIECAVEFCLNKLGRSRADIRELATIDLKATEPALITWCELEHITLRIIPKDLVAIRPWVTQRSDWVREVLGVEGVCEPCALLSGFRTQLLLPKTSVNGVSIAVAEEMGGVVR